MFDIHRMDSDWSFHPLDAVFYFITLSVLKPSENSLDFVETGLLNILISVEVQQN